MTGNGRQSGFLELLTWRTRIHLVCLAVVLSSFPVGAEAGESGVILVPQPIVGIRFPNLEHSEFKIVAVPYLNWYLHHPSPYTAIAQTNTLLTNAPRAERPPEANLLVLYGIRIGHDSERSVVHLRLESAQQLEGWSTDVRTAGLVALECIRRLSGAARPPTVKILASGNDAEYWRQVEERYAKHDFAQPFWVPDRSQADTP